MDQRVVAAGLAGRYAVEREVGRGGLATVYLARDLRHGRGVAVKVLEPEVALSLGAGHFLREIRIAAGLNHPHIMPVHDSGEAPLLDEHGARIGSLLYYVMPFVEGGSLRQVLAQLPQLPLDRALAVAREMGDALECAHRHGVIHRDIKPENILFQEGHAALADFGIARPPGDDAPHTDPGLRLGTPAYMSPEACEGGELDGRADQYGLACVVYEMLAGQPPFLAALPQLVMARHIADRVPPLTIMRPDLPVAVQDVLERALAKTAAERYPTMGAFTEALAAAGTGYATAALRSLAVLPFVNVGGLPEDEALCDGLTDEVIGALARSEGLRVASRTSVFALKGRREGAAALAGLLHVGVVLEGTVARVGERIRVAVQLVHAADELTLWAERFERDLRDVFAIQDEIATQVARALQVILHRDAPAGRRMPTGNVQAYEYYLRGRHYARLTRRKSLRFAREMFERAIGIDPLFAQAWSGLAVACATTHLFYPHESGEELAAADRASRRALELAPDLADAHAARGFALWRLHREDDALAEFAAGRRLDPRQFEALYFAARLLFQRGDAAGAAELFEAAARADEDYQARFFAAQSYEALGRVAEAEAAYRRALHVCEQHLAMNPDDPRAATMCAVSLCRTGRKREGLEWAERARQIDSEDAGVLYNVACVYALEGQPQRALDCLEQALRAGFGDAAWIVRDPDLASLRDEPRFAALVESS